MGIVGDSCSKLKRTAGHHCVTCQNNMILFSQNSSGHDRFCINVVFVCIYDTNFHLQRDSSAMAVRVQDLCYEASFH